MSHKICPVCGGTVKKILYGMPGPDFDDEKYIIGGCIVGFDEPDWGCSECEWQDYMGYLSSAQARDRAVGAILGMAVGDALGAPHEFQPPLPADYKLEMSGGNGWKPGEWTDDTSMAIAIMQVYAKHKTLQTEESLDELIEVWQEWAESAPDVGVQTRRVLSALEKPTAKAARDQAQKLHELTGMTAGNGSLMRTAPLAILNISLEDKAALARSVSDLTHFDPEAGDACVLWTLKISRAIKTGEVLDYWDLQFIPEERRDLWEHRIWAAIAGEPSSFENNGWVVSAFQAAYSAVHRSKGSFSKGIHSAVKAGYDTDTVAAIAGSLLGATVSSGEIPNKYLDPLHGWPGITSSGVAKLAALMAA